METCIFCGERLSLQEVWYPKEHQCDEKKAHFEQYTRATMHCNHNNERLVIRAREQKDVWGDRQVLECRQCGERRAE